MKRQRKSSNLAGLSLFELLITVAIIASITAIGMIAYTKTLGGVRRSVAWDKAEILNMGLKKYSQIVHDITTTADNDSTDDEYLVLRSLQWRSPTDPSLDSPYALPNYNPVASSDSKDYRIRWNGFVFEVLNPGDAGKGLKIDDDGSDLTTNYSFPTDYTPE